MKRIITTFLYLQLVSLLLLPLGATISAIFGCRFELISYPLWGLVTALLALTNAVLSVAVKATAHPKNNFLPVLSLPIALINTAFYILRCGSAAVVISMLICVASCCCQLAIHKGQFVWKAVALVLSAMMCIPLTFLSFLGLMFGNLAHNTVVMTVDSPTGYYRAVVTDSDQGALGGNTIVQVYENQQINALIFRISRKPTEVYRGEWGEYRDMELNWDSDNCLIINSVKYPIAGS